MMRMLLALLFVLLPSLASATTYYVATTGSDAAAGTSGAPFRSIQKGVTSAACGDTVTVADGTYTQADGNGSGDTGIVVYIRSSGNPSLNSVTCPSSNPVTVKSTNKNGATISMTALETKGNRGFRVTRGGWIIDGFIITATATLTSTNAAAAWTGVYADTGGNDLVIRNNRFYDIGRNLCVSTSLSVSGVFFRNVSNVVVEGNTFNKIGRLRMNGESGCVTGPSSLNHHDHAIYTGGGDTGTIIRRNVCWDSNRGYCIQSFGGTATNLTIVHNTFSGKTSTDWPISQMRLASTINTASVKNNIFADSLGAPIDATSLTATSVSITDNLAEFNDADLLRAAITGVTSSSNDVNESPGFVNAGSDDYTLAAGSTAIDGGTALAGYSYNGAAPDQGAYETPVFASCVVEDGDASTIRVTFTNNVNPPLLPATGITGFTARKAGANDVITAAVVTGDNRVDLTLTDAIVNGNTVDISYSGSGNLTDSALIGGTLNQGYKTVLTNQSCTNNVGAAASHVFTQAAFEFHGLRGTEAAPVGTPYATAPENTNIQVRVGGSVRLRIALTCTIADCPPTGFYPRYSKNAGAYTVIPDTFAADNIAFCGTSPDPDIPTNGTATTDQLSTAGAFVAGALVRTSNAIPTIDLDDSPAQKTELEYCISFDTDATAGDTYDIRLYEQDGTALGAYTVTPRITIAAERAGMGF